MRLYRIYVFLISVFIVISCCKKYPYPPTFQLSENSPLGIFQTQVVNGDSTISPLVTTKLVEYITYEQKGSFLELGNVTNILKRYNSSDLTSEVLREVGDDFKVKSIVLSEIEFSDVEPNFNLNFVNPSIYANVKLTATLRLKIYETETGALLYIKSIIKKTELSNVYVSKDMIFFNSKTFDESQYDLIDHLTWKITKDFRTVYKCK
ncbi:MAG: hypothetical protein ABIN35_05870 [candidate division WOR-3 bacterium]